MQLPIFKGGFVEESLQFLKEFWNTKSKLGYTNYQKLESRIKQLLQGTANDEWNTIKGTVQPGTNTIPTFDLRVEALQKIYIPEPAVVENQKTYVHPPCKEKWQITHSPLSRQTQINQFTLSPISGLKSTTVLH